MFFLYIQRITYSMALKILKYLPKWTSVSNDSIKKYQNLKIINSLHNVFMATQRTVDYITLLQKEQKFCHPKLQSRQWMKYQKQIKWRKNIRINFDLINKFNLNLHRYYFTILNLSSSLFIFLFFFIPFPDPPNSFIELFNPIPAKKLLFFHNKSQIEFQMKIFGFYSVIIFFLTFTIIISNDQDISIQAWVEEGYYFSHRCEVTLQIVSNYFESNYQLFHVLATQNAFFFNTVERQNTFYIKATNSIEAMMTSSEAYCKFPMTTTYYCPFISISGYDPYGISYFEQLNSTHRKLTISLTRPICPSEGNRMSFRIQMPVPQDYKNFYMFVPSVTNTTQATPDKLSFVYDNEVEVNLSNLEYKQVRSINFIEESNFVVDCKVEYKIEMRFDNLSYYNSWDQINIYISKQQSLSLSKQCHSTLKIAHFCERTNFGYKLTSINQVDLNKSYEIAQNEYYEYQPLGFSVSFGIQFVAPSRVDIEVVCEASNNSIQQSWLNMTHNSSQIYGRKKSTLMSFYKGDFNKISQSATKYDPFKCLNQISLHDQSTRQNPTSDYYFNNETNNPNTTVYQQSQDEKQSQFTFQTQIQSSRTSHLIFTACLISLISIILYFRKTILLCQNLLYVSIVFLLSISKIIILKLETNQQWFRASNTIRMDSTYNLLDTQYLFYQFLIKSILIVQFAFNLFYLLNYLVLTASSNQVLKRIKRFYGLKIHADKSLKQKKTSQESEIKCTISSLVLSFVTFLLFLLNFKFFGILMFKLQLNLNAQSQDFKKYRFRNSTLYKIHAGHLAIDLILEISTIFCLLLLIRSSQNEAFTLVMFGFLVFYCVHIYLIAIFIKAFLVMAKTTEFLNSKKKDQIKLTFPERLNN